MAKIKEFFSRQLLGFYLSLATAIFALVSIIAYSIMVTDLMGTSELVYAMLIVGLIVQTVTIALAQFKMTEKYFNFGTLITGAMFATALIALLVNRIPWFMSIESKNNVPDYHPAYFFAVVIIGMTLLTSIISAFCRTKKQI